MSKITDPDKVPFCRCCNIGHWSDEVDADGFCPKHIREKCKPKYEGGYYWIVDKNHPEPIIACYGWTDGIDQIDRSKRVISEYDWSLTYDQEDYGDYIDEETVKIIEFIKQPIISK